MLVPCRVEAYWYNMGMDASVRASLRRMDESRGVWWLVRRDFWPREMWDLSCDPDAGWDWRTKVGTHKCFAMQRLRAARERKKRSHLREAKLKQLRAIVDKMHP